VETASYLFVYYLMPLDPELPNLVLSVVPHIDGKASPDSNTHLKALQAVCRDHGFSIAAFSADGDSAYQGFLHPLIDFALSAAGKQLTFEQLVDLMPRCIEYPFITDFLHFLKCLRNRMARYLLSLHADLPPISADEIGRLLSIEHWLKPKSPADQLKDSVALRVFTFDNLVTLLAGGHLHEALYFMPITLWRLAIQGLNMTRGMRFRVINVAFDVVRTIEEFSNGTAAGLPETGDPGATVSFYRGEDIGKFVGSFLCLGRILKLPIDRIALNRAASNGLEHLFGSMRDGSKGDNHQEKLVHRIVTGTLVMQLVDKCGLVVHRRRHRNVAGTIDDISRHGSDGMVDLHDWLTGMSVVELLFALIALPYDPAEARKQWLGMAQQFVHVAGSVDDGQKDGAVTALAGSAIMPRMAAIENAGGGKFYWTRARKEQLAVQWMSTPNLEGTARALELDPDIVQKGLKKLQKMIG
jgi:hypothetical protein